MKAERTAKTESPFTRVVCLFSTYLFFYTQAKKPIPPLQQLVNIPIPIGKSPVSPALSESN